MTVKAKFLLAAFSYSMFTLCSPAWCAGDVFLSHTAMIGTPEYPTVEGGLINSTGKKLDQISQAANAVKIGKKWLSERRETKAFEDGWATHEQAKKLLAMAAKEGKLAYVLKKAEEQGLPASVALVPMIESRYQTTAISPKGAAGAWQLMPGTAKEQGIKSQERFDFNASTNAALKLLGELHRRFGNWELAYAAYNAGSQRIVAALQQSPQAKTILELNVPDETKNYVQRLKQINALLSVQAGDGPSI